MAKINEINFCQASVMHKRLSPTINQFVYRIFYLCFDITKTQKLQSRFFSLNRFNFFAFYEKDHAKKDGTNLEVWIRQILAQKNLNSKISRIFLMAHPRVLGFVFNPVSFWFCVDENDALIAVLAEVNNTFGENHNYLVSNQDRSPILASQWFGAKKEFHVSPFLPRVGNYQFRFIFNEKNCAAWVDYSIEETKRHLLTSVVAQNQKFCDAALLKAFFTIPLMTFKVVFLIHWQALKIISKKIKYIKKPKKFDHNITFNHE